jgi:iron uptake system component EfeO
VPGIERTYTLILESAPYQPLPSGVSAASGTPTVTEHNATMKLRQVALGIAALALVAACGTTANSSQAPSAGPAGPGSIAPDPSQPVAADSVSTYRAYLQTNADLLVQRTTPFVNAVVAGKLAEARVLYLAAHQVYAQMEPVAESFGDLDPAINALETDVPAGGTFSGFHRLERALWQAKSLAGMAPIAKKLQADVVKLQALVPTVDLDPATIANGAAAVLADVSASKLAGLEDRYSHTDLWDVEGNVVGAQAAYSAIRPLVVPRAATLASTIDSGFEAILAALKPFQKGTGYVLFTVLTPADTQALSAPIDAIADPLSQVAAIVVSAQ